MLWAQVADSSNQHDRINQAQKLYFEGNFDQAISLLKQCLQDGITADNEKVRAYKILAQAYLAKDYQQPAQEVVKKLLEIVPEYTPVMEEDPPQFIELVKKVRAENLAGTTEKAKTTGGKRSYWLWVGSAGAVILGTTAIILFAGPKEEKPKPLPAPPPWPE
jgi:tetratricopeptide (TPR) repeat protein